MTDQFTLTASLFIWWFSIPGKWHAQRTRESHVAHRVAFHLDVRSAPIDFTLISVISINRIDRIPFLIHRWKNRICLSVLLTEKEIPQVEDFINNFSKTRQITFILYIIREIPDVPFRSIYYDTFGADHYNQTLFPINLLRDLAIESIDTSHYVITDIDAFPSQSLYSSLKSHAKLLKNEKAVILIKTFRMNDQVINMKKCYHRGACLDMFIFWVQMRCRWDQIPYTKKSLKELYGTKVKSHDVMRHVVISREWQSRTLSMWM